MKQTQSKTARDIDRRLNQFLAGLFDTPITVQEIKKHNIPLPELTIEISQPLRHCANTLH